MEKANAGLRTITFYSLKNGKTISVNSREARAIARMLEADNSVLHYETCVPLQRPYPAGNAAGIRPAYLEQDWVTDFLVECLNGSFLVIEAAAADKLCKRALIEKLELSRRYWQGKVQDWKICICGEERGLGTVL